MTDKPNQAAVDEAVDRDCYVSQPLGKDENFDRWEKQFDPDRYYLRELKTKLSFERAMHKAWRKRAEEAEAAFITAAKSPAVGEDVVEKVRVALEFYANQAVVDRDRLRNSGYRYDIPISIAEQALALLERGKS